MQHHFYDVVLTTKLLVNLQKEGQAVTPNALKKAYTIYNDLSNHAEAIRFHPSLHLLLHHHYSMEASFYSPNLLFHSFIQAENMELPPQHQVTPSNLYQAAFCHMDTSSKLALLHFWKAHCSSSKKYGNVASVTSSLLNLICFTYTTTVQMRQVLGGAHQALEDSA
jgi:hypothetical protein